MRESRLADLPVLQVEGPLRTPVSSEVRHKVRALLHRGDRTILLSLARVSDIDAAGLGELVRAYNMTIAANGLLRITQTSRKVRELLDRVGLLDLLTTDYGSDTYGLS